MATRKRTSRRTGLVGRAVSAGRRALKEAESRIPPDLRRQLDRRLKDADKTARAAIKQLQAQVKKASTRADVNNVLKRIDGLTRQARQIAGGGPSRPAAARAATPRRRAATAGRAATRTRKPAAATRTRKPATATRKPRATAATTTRRAAATRRAAPRRRTSAPTIAEVTETVIPVDGGEIDVIEVTES